MKSGETGYLRITIANLTEEAMQLVNEIIFSIKSECSMIQKRYPENVTLEDGAFYIPLTQENTTALVGRYSVEAQINFADRSVSKSNIENGKMAQTVYTEFIEGNYPNDEEVAAFELEITPVQIVSGGGGGGTSDYNALTNRPQINGVTLSGNKTAADLRFASVATSGSYSDLTDKPTIPTYTAGTGISIEGGVISIDLPTAEGSEF